MLVSFGGSFLHSLFLLKGGPSAAQQTSSSSWAVGMVQEVSALLLLGYVFSRRGLTFANLGLRWSPRDIGVGLVVTGVSYVAYGLGSTLVQAMHHLVYGSFATSSTAKDFFAHASILAIPYLLLNPFFEELIVRAYLMTEVIELSGSSMLAVTLSVGIQFSYHLYYGWVVAISLSFLFLVFALYYKYARRALPVVVAHAFYDLYGLFGLWQTARPAWDTRLILWGAFKCYWKDHGFV